MGRETKLSQEEIDALLRGAAPAGGSDTEPTEALPQLTATEKDALGEIGNISFGSAATSLSMLLQQRVEITTPTVSLIESNNIEEDLRKPYVLVMVQYTAGLSGANALAIELGDAKTIADLMLGGDGKDVTTELNELHLSAVGEAMNQMMGGAATALSTIFSKPINISPPQVDIVDFSSNGAFQFDEADWIVNVAFRLKVGNLIDSKIMQLLPLPFAKGLVETLTSELEAAHTSQATQSRELPMGDLSSLTSPSQLSMVPPKDVAPRGSQGAPPMTGHLGNQPDSPVRQETPMLVGSATNAVIQRPEFVDFQTGVQPRLPMAPKNLALLFDVSLTVTVELGRTKKPIRDILDLAAGSIIELDKLAGEPVDILVNNKKIAVGEVVVIDENFGVRVTDILSPEDRVRNLQ